MKDMQAHLEMLRVQIAECELIRDLATDRAKRKQFDGLAQYYKVLSGEIERAIAEPILDRKTQRPSERAREVRKQAIFFRPVICVMRYWKKHDSTRRRLHRMRSLSKSAQVENEG